MRSASSKPLSIYVDLHGTAARGASPRRSDRHRRSTELVRLSPKGIREHLGT
jgi:hypothetical protein